MNIYITSDLHFGHSRIREFCPETRPFATVEEMDRAIINEWNRRVQPDDLVYHLGDMFFHRDWNRIDHIMNQLTGRIIWLKGNHDYRKTYDPILEKYGDRVSMENYVELDFNKQTVILFHYPIHEWNKGHRGSYHFHGHCHGNINRQNIGMRRRDAGWDAVGGKILTLQELIDTCKHEPVISHH